jgi:hypothetical protein
MMVCGVMNTPRKCEYVVSTASLECLRVMYARNPNRLCRTLVSVRDEIIVLTDSLTPRTICDPGPEAILCIVLKEGVRERGSDIFGTIFLFPVDLTG